MNVNPPSAFSTPTAGFHSDPRGRAPVYTHDALQVGQFPWLVKLTSPPGRPRSARSSSPPHAPIPTGPRWAYSAAPDGTTGAPNVSPDSLNEDSRTSQSSLQL